jgi:hypothetical protein
MPDFEIRNEGNVFLFTPLTGVCLQWLEENVVSGGWQWLGRSLAVDYRYAQQLRAGLIEAGFNGEFA